MTESELHQSISDHQGNICQIAVRKNGSLLYSDEWNGYSASDCVHIMSVTKGIVSLLTGIAVDHGMLRSIDEKVLSFFPDYKVKRGEKTIFDVTVRHLLTMRAPFKGHGDPWTKVCSSSDWTAASLDELGGRKGITGTFDYRTVCLHILSGILFRATGLRTADFANEFLLRPLGIRDRRNFYAETPEEHKAFTLKKTPKEPVWFADPQGLGTPGYGLCMSAQELALIGQFCLQDGLWEGQRLLSRQWLKDMTVPRPVEDGAFRGMHYGYLWWIPRPDRSSYAAIGNSGNVLYICPEKQLSVAVTSYFKPAVFDRLEFIEQTLIPFLNL